MTRTRSTDRPRRRRAEAGRAEYELARPPALEGSLADRVYSELLAGINSSRFAPGSRIRESEIANWLNVSRTPVREALRRLESEDILSKSDRGLIVSQLDERQIYELYAIREVLEGAASASAARHATPTEVEMLSLILEEAEATDSADSTRHAVLNKHFHEAIYDAADNRYLLKSLRSLHDAMTRLSVTTFSWPSRPEEALKEHRGILEAIEKHDVEGAEHLSRHHIRQALRYRLRIIHSSRRRGET